LDGKPKSKPKKKKKRIAKNKYQYNYLFLYIIYIDEWGKKIKNCKKEKLLIFLIFFFLI